MGMMGDDEERPMRGWWSGHKVIDPAEMERRFSNEDSLSSLDAIFYEEISEEGQELLLRVQDTLELLPPMESDFIDLYYFKHLKQTDIAIIFGCSQPTVHYRLRRAADRIQFLLALPALVPGELEEAMSQFLSDPLDTKIMTLMFQTTCQSEVGKRLGVTQGFVRHRFIRSIRRMNQALAHQAQVVEKAEAAVDMLKEWGALDALVEDEVEQVLRCMSEMGVLHPTASEIAAAGELLRQEHLAAQEEAQKLRTLFGAEGEPSEVPSEGFPIEEVLQRAQEIRVQKAREAVLAIEAREVQDAAALPDLTKYVTIFQAISENLNILREVQRPAWGDKVLLVVH
jgi:DNA-directed RNA polymerase specialized sigma24 family protein